MRKIYYITTNISGAFGTCSTTYLSSSLFPSKKAADKALKDSMINKSDENIFGHILKAVSWQWDNKDGMKEINKLPLIPIV